METYKKNGEIVPMKHEIGTLKTESLAKTIRISEKRAQPAIIVLGKIIWKGGGNGWKFWHKNGGASNSLVT